MIQTFTGKYVNPLNLKMEDIDIRDIAHCLSQLCRFTAHTNTFYSVAEHSLYVSYLLPDEWKLAGLLHDASEAYLCDLASPVKRAITGYKIHEEQAQDKIYRKFGINYVNHRRIKVVDNVVLYHEAMKLFNEDFGYFDKYKNDIPVNIQVCSPKVVEYKFLKQFERLKND